MGRIEDDHRPGEVVKGDLVPLQRAPVESKRVNESFATLDEVCLQIMKPYRRVVLT